MGIGRCCCLSGDFYLKSHYGKSGLDYIILNQSGDPQNQNPKFFDFENSNTEKFHSKAFTDGNDFAGIYSYDIAAEKDGSYVYVASGDYGLEVYKNSSGVLTKEKTISLGFSKRTQDQKLSSELVVGGSLGSMYGYEVNPFVGAYSVCLSKNKRGVYVAAGKKGLYYVDTVSEIYNLVIDLNALDINTIFNKVKIYSDFLFIGTTGYLTPSDKFRFHRYDSNYNYIDVQDCPRSQGAWVYRINEFSDLRQTFPVPVSPHLKESLTYQTRFYQGSNSLGVNDLYIKSGSFTIPAQNNQPEQIVGDSSLYIALGRKAYSKVTDNNGNTDDVFAQYGGAVRIIFTTKKNNDQASVDFGKREYLTVSGGISRDIAATGFDDSSYDSVAWRQPIKTITATKDKIYLSTGSRRGQISGSTHFPPGWDNANTTTESCTFTNTWDIENSIDEIGVKRASNHCPDESIPQFFSKRAWEYNALTNTIGLADHGQKNLNKSFATVIGESFVSDIKFFGSTKVSCYKGMGITIGTEDSFGKQVFYGLTMKETLDCQGYWVSGNGMFSYDGGFVNLTHSWSPIKSCKAGNFIFILNSMQCVANESGPGYFYVYNDDNKGSFSGATWEEFSSTNQARVSGVTVLQSENK